MQYQYLATKQTAMILLRDHYEFDTDSNAHIAKLLRRHIFSFCPTG